MLRRYGQSSYSRARTRRSPYQPRIGADSCAGEVGLPNEVNVLTRRRQARPIRRVCWSMKPDDEPPGLFQRAERRIYIGHTDECDWCHCQNLQTTRAEHSSASTNRCVYCKGECRPYKWSSTAKTFRAYTSRADRCR